MVRNSVFLVLLLSATPIMAAEKEAFKVAFVGDQGWTSETVDVLRLIKKEKSDLLVIPGDFDYKDDPDSWDRMLTQEIGELPILAAVGNHDLKAWDGYEDKLKARLARMPKAKCSGQIAVKHDCLYEGVQFVISGVGTLGTGHETFLDDSLRDSEAPFKVCVWHKNQRAMQVGAKKDETGWEAYEICRKRGAMIITAHEHSYSRTHLLSDFKNQTVASTSSILKVEAGKSFALVTGLGGKSIRDQEISGPYWASVYTSNQQAKSGALFCTFRVPGHPSRALCEFKNIAGEVIDSFAVEV
jgi:hypothetical protein